MKHRNKITQDKDILKGDATFSFEANLLDTFLKQKGSKYTIYQNIQQQTHHVLLALKSSS